MKRDKTIQWRGTLMLMLAVFNFNSCTKEPFGLGMPGGDGVEVRVTFPQSASTKATTGGTETGTSDENRLDRVTILIFNEDGSKLETALSEDVTSANTSLSATQPKWTSDQTLLVRPIVDPKAPKKIYAIANWDKTAFDKATYTEAMLKEELKTITTVADLNGAAAYPMLMSGSKELADMTSQFYSVTVNMERMVSKIRANVSISTAVQDYMPTIEWQMDLMKITIDNVPDKSYVVGRGALPSGSSLLVSDVIAVDDVKPLPSDQTVPATKDLKWAESVYIYENPTVGATAEVKAKSVYIIVQLPYKNRATGVVNQDNYYKLYVNDTRDAVSPHKVLRNTIYNFSIRILGMGLPINNLVPDVNVDDQLTVNSWDKVVIDARDTLNYFNIDRTHIGFQHTDAGGISSLKSIIVTDVPDWKLVKEDGSVMFSFADSKTAPMVVDGITYTLTGAATTALIEVDRGSVVNGFTTQKMYFIAKNLKVPFTVVYDNGFIPNSVLQAAGWPVDNLPAAGLQVAMRGDKQLPVSGTPRDDAQKQWKTDQTATAGVERVDDFVNAKFAMGKSSTDAMVATSALVELHPAAKYCRDMGPEWYLPSIKELKLIYDNKHLLGSSYSFTPINYWSATEKYTNISWSVLFDSGTSNWHFKNDATFVRCVRGI